jgi:hypothetical protein
MKNISDQPIDGEILLFGEKPLQVEKSTLFFFQSKSSIVDEDRKNKYLSCGDFFELPCPEKSLRSLRIRGGLERLERKYLYMILSEARRVLIVDGILDISAFDLKGYFSVLEFPLLKMFHLHPLNLHHFISPEDWAIHHEEKKESIFFVHRHLELKRIDGILPETDDVDLSVDDLLES